MERMTGIEPALSAWELACHGRSDLVLPVQRHFLTCPLLSAPPRCVPLDRARIGHTLSVVFGRIRQLVVLALVVSPARFNLTAGSVGSVKGGFSLDRFPFASTLVRRVRGGVPPHPLPSGERLLLIFPCCPWACFPGRCLSSWCSSTPGSALFLVCPPRASGARGWARCGVVVAGTTCGQVPGVITVRRAAATVAGQAEGRERASAAPGDDRPPG